MILSGIKKKIGFLMVLMLGIFVLPFPNRIQADTGKIYTCKINPSYAHPVTGNVEDSGGKSSMATGQGMVEGVLGSTGMLEVTDSGKCYLTITMSLIDYTSQQSFKVQKRGETAWSDTKMGVTSKGKDGNGTTANICIEIPDENSIVRGTMYVEPMGRNVIFYFYPSDFKEGKPDNMKAAIVTGKSSKTAKGTEKSEKNSASGDSNNDNNGNEQIESRSEQESAADNSGNSATGNSGNSVTGNSSNPAADNSNNSVTDNNSDSVKGLSLSTDQNSGETISGESSSNNGTEASRSMGEEIFILTISITLAGLILICASVCAIYFCRRNWNRWGGDMFED